MDKKTFVTLTLILTFTFTLAAYIRADGRSNRIPDITGEYYRQIEKDYVADIREKLDDNGFSNAGISLTKQVNERGDFDYTLCVHHRYIDRMQQSERDELSDMLTDHGIDIEGRHTTVAVRFIEY